jgi:5S rRNA maturation endonuclease (ribonuclease M5)
VVKRVRFRAVWLSVYAGSNPAARILVKKNDELKKIIEELYKAFDKYKTCLTIVEGKKDCDALKQLGFERIITLNKPLYEIAEGIKGGKIIILTDLDKKGKEIYSKLKKDLDKRGILVDDSLRNLLFKTELRQIEGLTAYLRKF